MTLENEQRLDDFSPMQRRAALTECIEQVEVGQIELPEAGDMVNLHGHTFFSYNCYGYSPTHFAWLARKAGLAAAGIVDFDVLDGLEEFLEASRLLGLKAVAGLETRVFVPEFADTEMTSPGEPGITYHMGVGFSTADIPSAAGQFLCELKNTAQARNKAMIELVNKHLSPVEIDYESDVVPLTPSGNATERHICLAYARKARDVFDDDNALLEFWADKLGVDISVTDLPEGVNLLNAIRGKTMKRGGVGYVQPDDDSFPTMSATNEFILAAGGIPTHAWLNGLSAGEQRLEELLEVGMSTGVAAINIIPDRNYTPGVKDEKFVNLCSVIELAEKLNLPVIVGTEMNSPGQKFVDDFDSAELKPFVPIFLKGANIVYAHSVLQKCCQCGYTSDWAKNKFSDVKSKNDFFEAVGKTFDPSSTKMSDSLAAMAAVPTPEQVLGALVG